MSKVCLFSDDWYGEMIARAERRLPDDASPDARAVSSALLVAGAMIAQSLSDALHEKRGESSIYTEAASIVSAMNDMADAITRIAERGE